ncbi:hypothetical protein COOONC_14013 [Cooperia oncophora]
MMQEILPHVIRSILRMLLVQKVSPASGPRQIKAKRKNRIENIFWNTRKELMEPSSFSTLSFQGPPCGGFLVLVTRSIGGQVVERCERSCPYGEVPIGGVCYGMESRR